MQSARTEVPFEMTLHIRDRCLCLQLQRATRAVSRCFDAALRPLNLTNGQFSLLISLNRPQVTRIGSVAALLGMDRTTMTAMLKPLERRGLVEVMIDPGDRRRRVLTLTQPGKSLLAVASPIWEQLHAQLEHRLDEANTEVLQRELSTLSQIS
ncbi:MAG: MarR family winged helix-turn-helix transcriptional regulator [Terriglobia bacterium]